MTDENEPASGRYNNIKRKHATGTRVPDEIKKLRGTYHKRNDHNVKAARTAKKAAKAAGTALPVVVDPQVIPSFICTASEMAVPPGLINAYAVREWETVVMPLARAGVIRMTDLKLAQVYCDMWGLYEEHRAKYAEEKMYPVKLVRDLSRIMAEIGLTPASRHRLSIFMKLVPPSESGAQPGDDDWREILKA